MFPYLRRLLAGAFALTSLIAFSSPALASASHAASHSATRHHAKPAPPPPASQLDPAAQRRRSGCRQQRWPERWRRQHLAACWRRPRSSHCSPWRAAAAPARQGREHATGTPAPFTWLRPAAVPAHWKIGRLPSRTADLAYSPGWRSIRTDPGTFSAALLGAHDRIRGYLNATPRSGAETLANWSSFRPAHNGEEGGRNVLSEASASGLRFRSGTGRSSSTGTRPRPTRAIERSPASSAARVGPPWSLPPPAPPTGRAGAATRARGGQLLDMSPRPRWRAYQPLATHRGRESLMVGLASPTILLGRRSPVAGRGLAFAAGVDGRSGVAARTAEP